MKKLAPYMLVLSLIVFSPQIVLAKDTMTFQTGNFDENGETITVIAKGLVCEFCAKALEKVFMKQEEVAAINVDLTTKEILINLKAGKMLDDKTITELITDSGYNIDKILRAKQS